MSDPTFDPQQFKAGQRHDWDQAAEGWKKWWPTFEQAAQHVSNRLIELANVKPGDRVLDIATGNGEPALSVAQRVGVAGRVVAVDQSDGMLANARERAASMHVTNVAFHQGDGESLSLSERDFDAVVCRWGLMFMPDLTGALKGIRARMKPGARFATAVWATGDKVPLITLGADAVRKLAGLPPPPPNVLDPMRLADTSILKQALEAAGFKAVAIERLQVVFDFATPATFTQFRRDIATPFRAILDRQTPALREQIIAAVTAAARAYAGGDGKVETSNETILFAASN